MRYAGLSTLRGWPPLRALIRGIRGDRDVALFRQALGIQARDLFLHPAVRVRHDDCRIFLLRIVVRRGVNIGGNIQTVELVRDRVNIDLARLILRDRAFIDQGERILLVVRCPGIARREPSHCRQKGGLHRYALHMNVPFNSNAWKPRHALAVIAVSPASFRPGIATPGPRSRHCSGPRTGSACCPGCRSPADARP